VGIGSYVENLSGSARSVEIIGLNFHLEVGLPTSEVIIVNAFRHLAELGIIPNAGELPRQVLSLFLSRFAWHAHRRWSVPVALDLIDEDAALDALAEFVWSRRHAGRAAVS
jgi:hypothetical protein